MSDDHPPIPGALFIGVCPNCAYSLTGLPDFGVCPECGRKFDRSELILYGAAMGQHESIANAKRSRIAWLIFATFGFVLLQAWPSLALRRMESLWYLLLPLIPIAYFLSRRNSNEHPGQVQVRLNERGCVQYDDLAGPSVIREGLGLYGWLLPAAAPLVLMMGWGGGWIDSILIWVWGPLMAFGTVFAGVLCFRFSAALRKVRDGSVADVYEAYTTPTPWADVEEISLHKSGSEHHRLRIRRYVKFLELRANRFPVDAAISCSAEQAEQLKRLLEQWTEMAKKREVVRTLGIQNGISLPSK